MPRSDPLPALPSFRDTPILTLLGGAIISADGKPLGGPAAHRHRIALLALLAVGGLTSRDKLVAYLWPERDTAGARNLLKTAIHELRKVLGEDAIVSVADQLSLNPDRLRCDVTEFEAATAAGDWDTASALYRGPFLDGFFLKDASEFEDWASMRRLRLESAFDRVETILASRPAKVPASPTVEVQSIASPRARARARPLWAVVGTGLVAVAAFAVLASRLFGNMAAGGGQKPVILPDDNPGFALQFNGVDANASTSRGTVLTKQVDDIAWDMLVRYDGPTATKNPAIFYNGHGSWSGWGVLLVGPRDGQADGTIGVLAGGIVLTATPLVMKHGVWQHLTAERRGGRVTVWLDDDSFALGPFPVHPVNGEFRSIERTSFGGDGLADTPTGDFHGAIDHVRVRDLSSNWAMERLDFDEGHGSTTVGRLGTIVHTGRATWITGAPRPTRDVFWSRFESLCGHAYRGQIATAGAVEPTDTALARGPLVLDVRACTPTAIHGAFDVGDDRSRTWVLMRSADGLRLDQERRRPDGSVEPGNLMTAETRDSGTVGRQEFFFDAATPLARQAERAWSIDIEPPRTIAFALPRRGRSPLQLQFDLERVIAAPPPPWGDR